MELGHKRISVQQKFVNNFIHFMFNSKTAGGGTNSLVVVFTKNYYSEKL